MASTGYWSFLSQQDRLQNNKQLIEEAEWGARLMRKESLRLRTDQRCDLPQQKISNTKFTFALQVPWKTQA
ncbi:hypothetical protein J6590_066629 [Homalodisca vitripennis]|nr:hypothetical protein J6590_066629 [Homalodisca vitripennis]